MAAVDSHLMETSSGRLVDPFALDHRSICVDDIFVALSRQCRFGGHAPICVAQHSLGVSELLRLRGYPDIVQLRGLMHDAAEAYMPDLIRPLKSRKVFGVLIEAEAKVLRTIWFVLGLGDPSVGITEEIATADKDMCLIEADACMESKGQGWPGYSAEMVKIWSSGVRDYLVERNWSWWHGLMRNRYCELKASCEGEG